MHMKNSPLGITLLLLLISMSAMGRAQSIADSVLTIPAGVREIPERAYSGRTDIREVRVEGSTLKKIGRSAFEWCQNLKSVSLPAGLDDIASHAFAYCSSLTHIGIPSSVRHIGSNVFSFCKSLPSITIPASLRELESYAFSECSSLHEATLPANANLLGEMIFAGCYNLVILRVPSQEPPPFDCNSQPFDPEEGFMYDKCHLMVPPQSIGKYQKAQGWSKFRHIEKIP